MDSTGETQEIRSSLPKALISFRHRNFRLWFIGQSISLIGTWMQIIAQGWLVYQISQSEFILGVYSFASAVPSLIVSPWAGVVADRVHRRYLLLATQTGYMLMAFILTWLTFSGQVKVWHIILLGLLGGVANAFDSPARLAFAHDLVGREDLTNSIALNATMFNLARVLGPAFGGCCWLRLAPDGVSSSTASVFWRSSSACLSCASHR